MHWILIQNTTFLLHTITLELAINKRQLVLTTLSILKNKSACAMCIKRRLLHTQEYVLLLGEYLMNIDIF